MVMFFASLVTIATRERQIGRCPQRDVPTRDYVTSAHLDGVAHTGSRSSDHQLSVLQNLTDLLRHTFSSQFVFPVLGHEDPNPALGQSYREVADLWRHWLPTEALQTFNKVIYHKGKILRYEPRIEPGTSRTAARDHYTTRPVNCLMNCRERWSQKANHRFKYKSQVLSTPVSDISVKHLVWSEIPLKALLFSLPDTLVSSLRSTIFPLIRDFQLEWELY
uniref:Uncharacterized protein n=1 Tax=Timema genevievae TaxID=629358 RepID=A0A7R9PNN0_TIMGE|nr:unnamed protein product [Timema genevievae]